MFGGLGGLGGLGGILPIYMIFFVINLVLQLVTGNLNLEELFGGMPAEMM